MSTNKPSIGGVVLENGKKLITNLKHVHGILYIEVKVFEQ